MEIYAVGNKWLKKSGLQINLATDKVSSSHLKQLLKTEGVVESPAW